MKRWKRGLFLFVSIGIVALGLANFAFCGSITLSTQLGAGGGLWTGKDTDSDGNIDAIHPNEYSWLIDYGTAPEDQNGTNITLNAQDGGPTSLVTGTNGGNIILMPGSGLGNGSSGNVGIGMTSLGYKLDVAGSAHSSSFPVSSDVRFKTDIAPLRNVLDKLEKVRGVESNWMENTKNLAGPLTEGK